MTAEKKNSWIAQGLAALGVTVWIGVLVHYGHAQVGDLEINLYKIAGVIALFGIPATLYNLYREATSLLPICAD